MSNGDSEKSLFARNILIPIPDESIMKRILEIIVGLFLWETFIKIQTIFFVFQLLAKADGKLCR